MSDGKSHCWTGALEKQGEVRIIHVAAELEICRFTLVNTEVQIEIFIDMYKYTG